MHQGFWERPQVASFRRPYVWSCEATETMWFLFLPLHCSYKVYMVSFGSAKTAGVWERELIFYKHYHKHDLLPVFDVKKSSCSEWKTILIILKHNIFNETTENGILCPRESRKCYSLSHLKPAKFEKKDVTALQGLCNSAMTTLWGSPLCVHLTK